jgi:RimJ/RimL family protein N-acetyltransferase
VINIRKADISDIDTYFKWANEESVRILSFNSEKISYEEHIKWFNNQLLDENCFMFIFSSIIDFGQVRIHKISNNDAVISISIDENFRGKGFGVQMLMMSIELFRKSFPLVIINAYIKVENIASKIIFEKSGFSFKEVLIDKTSKSYHLIHS